MVYGQSHHFGAMSLPSTLAKMLPAAVNLRSARQRWKSMYLAADIVRHQEVNAYKLQVCSQNYQ